MSVTKEVNKSVFEVLVKKGVEKSIDAIYLSDGLYMTECGNIIEESDLC